MADRPSPEAFELVATALGRALEEVITTGGPVLPTSLHRTPDGDLLERYRARTLEDALAGARQQLLGRGGETWVLVWDGYLTVDGWRTDALYGHLEVVGEDHAHLFAWRYGLLEDGTVGPLEPTRYLGLDGRFDRPGRSHPLAPGEGPTAPHGQVLPPRRRWWQRRGR